MGVFLAVFVLITRGPSDAAARVEDVTGRGMRPVRVEREFPEVESKSPKMLVSDCTKIKITSDEGSSNSMDDDNHNNNPDNNIITTISIPAEPISSSISSKVTSNVLPTVPDAPTIPSSSDGKVTPRKYRSTPYYSIKITAENVLLSFIWLNVPFVPASGVFLKLGTLLAERLLYVPSVGFCMLLSITVYTVCTWISHSVMIIFGFRTRKPRFQSLSQREFSSLTSQSTQPTDCPDPDHNPDLNTSPNPKLNPNTDSDLTPNKDHNPDSNTVTDTTRDQPITNRTSDTVIDTGLVQPIPIPPTTTPPTRGRARILAIENTITLALYWMVIITLAALYLWKTASHLSVWRNDESLHTHTLSVCPQSAKVNLQIGKIMINH